MTSSRSRRRRNRYLPFMAMALLAAFLCQGAAAAPDITSVSFPRAADAGTPTTVSVNVTSDMPIHDVQRVRISIVHPYSSPFDEMMLASGNLTEGTWTYEIPAQQWKGRVEFFITAVDGSGDSVRYPASGALSIEILGEEPPKQFPWNIAVMIAVLAVVLILTELIYKPGFYRPTGRERARKLEEEDREREKED